MCLNSKFYSKSKINASFYGMSSKKFQDQGIYLSYFKEALNVKTKENREDYYVRKEKRSKSG